MVRLHLELYRNRHLGFFALGLGFSGYLLEGEVVMMCLAELRRAALRVSPTSGFRNFLEPLRVSEGVVGQAVPAVVFARSPFSSCIVSCAGVEGAADSLLSVCDL